jgi:hypothetical protein
MQDRFLQQLKQQLLSWKIEGVSYEDIDKIAFLSQSLDDDEKEMKILTGYQKTGVLSINEVRVKAELGDAVEGGDEHKAIS